MRPNGFDRLARPYRWMEYLSFGPLLQRCRTHYLPRLRGVRNALVLGDGDGRFAARLFEVAPDAHVTAIDGSAAMLAQMRLNCRSNADRLTMHQAEIPYGMAEVTHGQTYDLVTTHFFLDCLTTGEVKQLARTIRPRLTDDAVWVVSDFAVPPGIMKLPSALIVAALYRTFRLLTGMHADHLPRHDEALWACGFERVERTAQLGGLLIAELWRRTADEAE